VPHNLFLFCFVVSSVQIVRVKILLVVYLLAKSAVHQDFPNVSYVHVSRNFSFPFLAQPSEGSAAQLVILLAADDR